MRCGYSCATSLKFLAHDEYAHTCDVSGPHASRVRAGHTTRFRLPPPGLYRSTNDKLTCGAVQEMLPQSYLGWKCKINFEQYPLVSYVLYGSLGLKIRTEKNSLTYWERIIMYVFQCGRYTLSFTDKDHVDECYQWRQFILSCLMCTLEAAKILLPTSNSN